MPCNQNMNKKISTLSFSLLSALFLGLSFFVSVSSASAHEVYVLSQNEIATAIKDPSPDPFSSIPSQELQFLIWGAVIALLILIVLRLSLFKRLEDMCDPYLFKLKKYASVVARVTLGISLIASSYFSALFGHELPLSSIMPNQEFFLRLLLLFLGILITLGLWTRSASLTVLATFIFAIFRLHAYMLTYLNYLGEIMLALILGGGLFSTDHLLGKKPKSMIRLLGHHIERYAFLILRVCFGFSIFFASFYAKYLHSNLALQTVKDYDLTHYLHFTPLFLVLGAFIIEALIGLFIIAGLEIRFAVIVFSGFMTVSILFFGEAVWPHLILFGVNIALFLHGYDRFTIEKIIFERKTAEEPVL